MVHQIRVPTALAEDPGLVPSKQSVSQPCETLIPKAPVPSTGRCGLLHAGGAVCSCKPMSTHINKDKPPLFFFIFNKG